MQLAKHTDMRDGSSCTLELDETEGWLLATWLGHVEPNEAYNGASRYLDVLSNLRCPYLLNDNSRLSGPWFDSVDWLQRVWGPRAVALGLRYIAHVAQPHDLLGHAAALHESPFGQELHIQLFDDVASAQEWLRSVQQRTVASPAAPPLA